MNFPTGFTFGVSAQEVQSVLPELVQTDSLGYLAVNYIGLIPIMLESIKEQQSVIEQQSALINEQGDRITSMEHELINCCVTNSNGLKNEQIQNNYCGDINSVNQKIILYQNTPNPFDKKTTIRYFVPENIDQSSIFVFDMQGKLVKTYPITGKGDGSVEIKANELQPGMYLYSLITGGKEIDTKRMILTK